MVSRALKIRMNKNWLLRAMALLLTVLCAVSLHDVGEPRPLSVSIVRGVVLSLVLNGALWLCSFEFIRVKLKYIATVFIFISGLGVFVISPYGWTLAFLLLLFHLWFVFDLLKGGETT